MTNELEKLADKMIVDCLYCERCCYCEHEELCKRLSIIPEDTTRKKLVSKLKKVGG